jgi:hypothetical protein
MKVKANYKFSGETVSGKTVRGKTVNKKRSAYSSGNLLHHPQNASSQRHG